MASALRGRLFGIDPREVTFAVRGFRAAHPGAVAELERVGRAFVDGYRKALETPAAAPLGQRLDALEPRYRGFAYEGAGMALALLDLLAPWRRNRLAAFLAGAGAAHPYMVPIGAGWAWARLRLGDRGRRRLDPVLGWLALDGYGFHQGYFHPRRTVEQGFVPRRLGRHARRVFDTGVGRSLWFVAGADPDAVAGAIGGFIPGRQPDLWSGAGLACCYAGGVDDDAVARLVACAGEHRGSLAQGAAFAAEARERAGIPAEHTRRAVERICQTGVDVAAKLCETELARARAAGPHGDEPLFARWRRGLRQAFERAFGLPEASP